MVSESQPESSDAADPFAGYSTLSLFSRALTSSMAAADPAPPAGDIDSLHSYLTSRALRRPETLLEQAKTILDSSLETLMTDNISTTEHHSATEALDVAAKENPQERRPALGRKRAQFSLRTNSSQPEVTLEPSVDIDQLQDPEEYFLAMEKLENTKKELQKYRGAVLMDLDPNVPSMTQRRRRPGLERNSATFKHLYSTLPTDDHNSPLSSLETSAREVQIPFCGKMQTENADLDTTSPDGKSGSRKSANRDILEKLLAVNYEHLDGDGVLNCLREHLRVKPIDLSKSCLPDLHDVRQHRSLTWRETKLKMPDTSRETMPKMADKLSHLSAMKESISSKASTGDNKVTEGSISLKSPTQPRNLFASISSLARRTPQTIPVEDPFSALDMGSSPRWHSHQVEQVHNRADQDDAGKNSMVSAGSEPQGHGETNVAATCRDSLVSAANDTASSGESLGGNTNGVNAGNFNLDIVPEYNIETDTVHSNVDGNASRHLKDAVCTSATADEVMQVFNTSGSGELQLNDSSIRQGENVTVYGESEPQGHGERSVAATCDDSQVSRATDSVPSGNSLRGCVEGVKAGDFSSNIVPEHDIENNTVDRSVDSNHTRVSEDAVCTIATSNPEEFLNEGNNALDSGELQGNQSSITQGEADAIPASTNDQPQYPCEENPELPEGTPNQRKKRKAPSKVTASRKKKANVSSNRCQKGQESNNQSAEVSSAFGAGDHGDIGEPSNTQDASLEKSSEGTPKPAPRQVKRKRENLRRKSLAAAGMQWESGVRRSTRIRMRPLEYWKGERVLYGRVHQSLVTVIGVKMSSPSESAIKVKSFISDEYKELVELAALH